MVPDVECVNVLKKVPELQCTPEIFEDCNEVEKKIPYLEEQEDCVEITCELVDYDCPFLRHYKTLAPALISLMKVS